MSHLFNPPPLTEEGTKAEKGGSPKAALQLPGLAAATSGLLVCHVGSAP